MFLVHWDFRAVLSTDNIGSSWYCCNISCEPDKCSKTLLGRACWLDDEVALLLFCCDVLLLLSFEAFIVVLFSTIEDECPNKEEFVWEIIEEELIVDEAGCWQLLGSIKFEEFCCELTNEFGKAWGWDRL